MHTHKQVTQQDVDNLVAWMQQYLPRFAVCYKDESKLQQLIGWLLWPINRYYMTHYTTVMFGKIYFPSREELEAWGPTQVYSTLRHEFVHLMDAKRFPIWFELSYLLLFPAGLTLRAYWEWRGYTQTLLVEHELYGTISDDIQEHILRRFVNSEYGWMFPFPRWLRKKLRSLCHDIETNAVQGPYPYKEWGQTTPPLACE